jgi:hypothetical protein
VCWVHSVRGEEFAAAPSAPEVRPALRQQQLQQQHLAAAAASSMSLCIGNTGKCAASHTAAYVRAPCLLAWRVASSRLLQDVSCLLLPCLPCCQAPALLQVLQDSLAKPEDIFLVNFGRWHFHNCIGLLTDSYTQSLIQLGAFYQVSVGGKGVMKGSTGGSWWPRMAEPQLPHAASVALRAVAC